MSRACLHLIAVSVVVSGCFTAKRTTVNMEPLLIEVGEADTYRTFSPRDLLAEANADLDCDRAIDGYRRIIREFAGTPQARRAAYNMGLCYEVQSRWADARDAYAAALEMMRPDHELALDARLRRAYCLEKLSQHASAASAYRKLSKARGVPERLRLGSRLREGIAWINAGRRSKGERLLERSLADARAALDRIGDDVRASAAEAAFVRAEANASDFRALPLRLPSETLVEDLRNKTAALTATRNDYIRAMSYRDAYWAASAAVRVGGLYEHLHDEIVSLPEPELSEAELVKYRAQVQQRVTPLRQRAFEAYLQVLLLAERVGFETEDTRRAKSRVHALEALLKEQVLDQGHERDVNGESDK